ncbi:uncharacterized protein LOC107813105 [Nicotiana tabacum]|uniref:Uncharacterized protein LOC107813105 n=1 Tax=Nicotiana tabacum TaxID=4097 RepID=A0A1S4BY33_TOBAC|nr:PREDICTED: uncharacterized protein LOC107813105 [Nicotiana tabacum]
MAVDMNIKELLVIGDSNLLIHQVQGEWSTKNIKILPYLHCVRELCKKLTKIEFNHVPRIQNEFANAFTTISSMIQHPDKNFIDPIKVEIKDQHTYCFHVNKEPDGKPWYHDIKKFLTTQEYPENATNGQQRALRRMASDFNKRVKPRQFTPGQLVLKKIFPNQEEAKGKFAPNWQCLYMVHRALSGGALILE